jgi:putative spermidine/putrescine transport system ATP-binding protein
MIDPADVTLTAVTKRYGSVVAVDAINFTVPKGTYCCLLGPSGCGKTRLRMIAGHERVSDGEIMLGR